MEVFERSVLWLSRVLPFVLFSARVSCWRRTPQMTNSGPVHHQPTTAPPRPTLKARCSLRGAQGRLIQETLGLVRPRQARRAKHPLAPRPRPKARQKRRSNLNASTPRSNGYDHPPALFRLRRLAFPRRGAKRPLRGGAGLGLARRPVLFSRENTERV
jgi:hypothetical protein